MPQDFSQFNAPSFQPWAPGIDLGQFLASLGGPKPGQAPAAGAPPADSNAAPPQDASSGPDSPQPVMPFTGQNALPQQSAPATQAAQPPQSIAGKLHDKIQDILTGGTPQGYEGLLTPDEIRKAKPSLLHSLIHGADESAASQYANNLNGLVERKMFSSQVARAQQLQGDRSRVEQDLGPAPGDAEGFKTWARRAYGAYSSIGDLDSMNKLNVVMQQVLAGDINKKGEQTDIFKDAQGGLHYLDKSAKTPIPSDWTLVQKPNASSATTMFHNPKATGTDPKYVSVPNTDNETIASLSQKGYEPVQDVRADMTNDRLSSQYNQTTNNQLKQRYESNISKLVTKADTYDKALTTFDRGLHSNDPTERKMLYGSLMSQFVQGSDQSNNLRFQLLQYYEHNINPSVAGTFNIFMNKLTNGELPPDITKGMARHLESLRDQVSDAMDKRRSEYLRNNTGQVEDSDLPETNSFFTFAPHTSILDGGSKLVPSAGAPPDINDVEAYLKYRRGGNKP